MIKFLAIPLELSVVGNFRRLEIPLLSHLILSSISALLFLPVINATSSVHMGAFLFDMFLPSLSHNQEFLFYITYLQLRELCFLLPE